MHHFSIQIATKNILVNFRPYRKREPRHYRILLLLFSQTSQLYQLQKGSQLGCLKQENFKPNTIVSIPRRHITYSYKIYQLQQPHQPYFLHCFFL